MGTNYHRIPKQGETTDNKMRLLDSIDTIIKMQDGPHMVSELEDLISEFSEDNNLHLGKRSSGWKFLWNFNNNKYYSNKEELIDFVMSGDVIDEYGEIINSEEFLEMAFGWGKDGGKVVDQEYINKQNYPFSVEPDLIVDGLRVSTCTNFS